MLRVLNHLLLPFAAAAGVVAAGVVYTLHQAPPARPHGVEILGGRPYDGQRVAAKERIAGDAAAGRLTLLQAASALKAMDAEGAPYPTEVITNYNPGMSLDEGYCHMVISWVARQAPPGESGPSVYRLEGELNAWLKDGAIPPLESAGRPIPPRVLTP